MSKICKCGSIDLLGNYDGNFLSKAIMFFTNSKVSHTDFTMGNLVREESVLSAQELMSVLPLKTYIYDENYVFSIYEWEGVPEDELERYVTSMYLDFAGKFYGAGQLVWFTYRWLMEKIKKDVRKQSNWMSSNAICSELVYILMQKVAANNRYPALQAKLDEFTQDTVTPEDVRQIVEQFPDIFKLKMTSDHGKIAMYPGAKI